jgi:hypothetical protein
VGPIKHNRHAVRWLPVTSKRTSFALALAAIALAGASGVAAAGGLEEDPSPRGAACGRPGQPVCPMQAWMRDELGAPLGRGKLAEVGKALERLATASPDPHWVLWVSSSRDGAAAAARGDAAGARTSCRVCHDAYRIEYRKRFRTRPPPP